MTALRGRALLEHLYDTAVLAVEPGRLVADALEASAPDLHSARTVHLLAAGKAAPGMADAAVRAVERVGCAVAGGLVVGAADSPDPHPLVTAVVGDHPVPGDRSFAGARRLEQAVAHARTGDVAVVLLSGGASSLIASPRPGLPEEDVQRLFTLLLRSGLEISQVNQVRKRFTRWSAGGMALALAPARIEAMVVSDVPGDDPADIASGPCSPDPSTAAEVAALLRRTGLHESLPLSLRAHLEDAMRGAKAETPKPGHPRFSQVRLRVVGSNRVALDAVVARCASLGLPVTRASSPLSGDAAAMGTAIADELRRRAGAGVEGVIVWGGETTVELPPHAPPGGRCQHLALAAARRLAAEPRNGLRPSLLAAGTDGRDGPTDAAGAFADDALWHDIAKHGVDPARALAGYESYAALDGAGALLRRGLSGTNVMDLVIGVVERAPATR